MIVRIRKSGTSGVIGIPMALFRSANMHLGQEAGLYAQPGRLIVQPPDQPHYDLAELVAGIIDDNQHDLLLDGPPPGRGVW
jgi:antitoxin MazE